MISTQMTKIKEFFSRRFGEKKKRTWNGPGKYLHSKEFLQDVHEAAVKGAQDQGRFMRSMGVKDW